MMPSSTLCWNAAAAGSTLAPTSIALSASADKVRTIFIAISPLTFS